MGRHRMAPADAAWLRMDRPTNLMVVNAVMWFDEVVDVDDLRAVLRERVLDRFPRFSQRAVDEHGAWWEDVEDFDPDPHLHEVTLPAPAGRAELEAFVTARISEPLDRARPLWELYLVTPYDGAGSALFFRIHHAIADGIALARLLLSLTDDPDAEPADVLAPAAEHSGTAAELLGGLWHEGLRLVTDPARGVELARTVVADMGALAKLLLLLPDRRTPLRGSAGIEKSAVWSEPIALDRIRETGHRLGATVNDILLAAVSGAIRSHLVRERCDVHDIRAIVPFNLRPLEEPLPAELGNQFGLVYLSLPVAVPQRKLRLREMHRRMDAIKHSAEGVVTFGVLELLGHGPAGLEDLAIEIFAAKATGVMTNVPGPRRPVTLAGKPMKGIIGWVPTSGEIGLGVAIFSYAGEVTIGLCADRGLVPDVHTLLADTTSELDNVLTLTDLRTRHH